MSTETETRWRKRPVEIEARQFTEDDAFAIADWCHGVVLAAASPPAKLAIETLEGTMIAAYGDWIIKGVKGEFYPCREDIFAATYEPADSPSPVAVARDLEAEVRETVTTFLSVRGGGQGAQDLAEAVCQVLDKKPLERSEEDTRDE